MRLAPAAPVAGAGLDPLVRLLEDRGLLEPGRGHVVWRRRQRHDTLLVADGTRTLCVKRRGAPLVDGAPTLSRELWFHRLVNGDELDPRLTRHVPRLVDTVDDSTLVFEGIVGARGLRDVVRAGADVDLDGALTEIGETLAALHQRPPDGAEPLPAPVQTYGRLTPEQLAHAPRAAPELIRHLQAVPGLEAALRELRASWRPEALVHGDVKADNVVVGSVPQQRVYLVDWELAGAGDPAWDCGSVLGSSFMLWLESLSPGIDSDVARDRGRGVLAAARSFTEAYQRERRDVATFPGAPDGDLALRWAGYWLLQRVTIMLPVRRALSALDLSALHLATELLVGSGRAR